MVAAAASSLCVSKGGVGVEVMMVMEVFVVAALINGGGGGRRMFRLRYIRSGSIQ